MDLKKDNISYDLAKEDALNELIDYVKGISSSVPAELDRKMAVYFRASYCDHPVQEHRCGRCGIAAQELYICALPLLDRDREWGKAKRYLDHCAERDLLSLLQ